MTAAARNPLLGLLPDLFGAAGKAARAADDRRNEVERAAPGTVRFDGVLAGLFGRTGSGDRNDPANYSIFCPVCGAALGVLARYRADRLGFRAVRCVGLDAQGRVCDHVTVMKDATIARVAPGAAWDAYMSSQAQKSAHERALERVELAEKAKRDGFDDV